MQCAGAVLESARRKLEWLGQTEDLGMPTFLPWLPKPQQDRLEAMVERELTRWVHRAERAHKAKRSKESKGRTTRIFAIARGRPSPSTHKSS